jgi:mannose-6-phosphate isomerase-like protein (cupin superfamily)
MERIWSKAEPGKLLHLIHRKEDFGKEERARLSPSAETLMCAAISMDCGKAFQPHRHLPQDRQTDHTQEIWIVIRGMVTVAYYDTDDSYLCSRDLHDGDCTITLAGGHGYQAGEETLVYEIKTGPYHGRDRDKVYVDGGEWANDTDHQLGG